MSAFADDPGHFARWLSRQADGPQTEGDPGFRFVSRGLYGRYLESLVLEHLSGPNKRRALTVARNVACGVTVTPSGVEIALAAAAPLHADLAILACGHESAVDEGPLAVSPWAEPASAGAPRDAALLILGTGLTMVDTALALQEQGHRGRIVAFSRRGLAPHAHRAVEPMRIDADAAPFDQDIPTQLAFGSGVSRASARRRAATGAASSTALRPHTQAIWRAMTPGRRARFLEHARPWWDIHRHRMAPQVAARIGAMIADGRLEIVAGKIVEVAPNDQGANVALRRRGSQTVEPLAVARIIFCKGLTSNPDKSANPLVASLFANGLARADPLRIGIEVATDCAVVDREGHP